MHDCRSCQTPLHGHESFCPVCGLKQVVRPQFQGNVIDYSQRTSNPMGILLIILIVVAFLVYAVQDSWIGQAIRRGPPVVDAESSLTQQAAREKLENGIIQNLAEQSSTGKFTYKCDDKIVDRNFPKPVELNIEVRLKYPQKRRSIIEPLKSLMVPAHINTITLNDERSHATVTYSVTAASADDTNDKDNENAPVLQGSSQ